MAYKTVTGLTIASDSGSDSDNTCTDSSDDDSDDDASRFKNSHRPRDESPTSKKVLECLRIINQSIQFHSFLLHQERKRLVKEQQAEKRKNKMKKHTKKRKEKSGRKSVK